MKSITIYIHSFVDLITNSSSETFICASEQTLRAIERVIDAILIADGSTLRCNDVLTLELTDGGEYEIVGVKATAKVEQFTGAAAAIEKLQSAFGTAEVMC